MWITGYDTQYKSPEERKSAKFSQAACLDEDSSGTDADADLPGGSEFRTAPGQNRTKLRKSASGSDRGHRRRPTWRFVARL